MTALLVGWFDMGTTDNLDVIVKSVEFYRFK
jgi:hypothetical protein